MSLQSQNLVMIGLGVKDDSPPNSIQPRLVDGIHLRWAFNLESGFPWHGFYLFRRFHRKANPLCISQGTNNLSVGFWQGTELPIPNQGRISSDQNLFLSDDFSPVDTVEFDLKGRNYLSFTLDGPAHLVEVHIGFRDKGEIEVTAILLNTPVTQTVITGNAGDRLVATLEFDSITEVKFSS